MKCEKKMVQHFKEKQCECSATVVETFDGDVDDDNDDDV